MIPRLKTLLGLCAVARASQPSAPAPIPATLRELPWGQLNFLHTTDTHGWHAGHLQEPSYGADWGDYISFSTHLRNKADNDGSDLLVIETGDRIEGNGLYDASDPKGNYTREILKHQHIDIMTIGNHELYKANSSKNEYDIVVPNYKNSYISSNLDYIRPSGGERVPLAPRFKKFTTKNQGIRVMAFGFLFDFTGNAKNTVVTPVKEAIKEQWFQDAIRDREVDLIIVAGHVPVRSPEFTAIFKEIREIQWDTPIIFFGGHTHIRDYKKYDNKAYALESGRYMETIGFQSITGLSTGGKPKSFSNPTFERLYIDNNLYSYFHHARLNETTFPTELGQNVTKQIQAARKSLDLDTTFGCAPRDLWLSRVPYPHENSIFTWIDSEVLPDKIADEKRTANPRIILGNTGAIRFDMFEGPFTTDTMYAVSPFTGGVRFIPDVPYSVADQMISVLNNEGPIFDQAGLEAFRLTPPEQMSIHHDIFAQGDREVSRAFTGHGWQKQLSDKPQMTPGYTTKDDAGTDGDDTIHSEIPFYRAPNCFETRINTTTLINGEQEPVEKVDLVFMEFIQPWIIMALQFLGSPYGANSTEPYMEGTEFNSIIADWIADNWKENCSS